MASRMCAYCWGTPRRKPLTSETPEARVCDGCTRGFLSIREPTYCPFCGETLDMEGDR